MPLFVIVTVFSLDRTYAETIEDSQKYFLENDDFMVIKELHNSTI